MKNQYFSARRITWFAILLALVVVLQIWGSAIPVGATRLCFTLVPIVLGSILLGPIAGMLLGVAFGVVVLISALVGGDVFTMYLLQESPVMTLLIIFVKGALCGFIPGLCYKALKKRPLLATFVAGAVAPIMNTGIFVLGALIISGAVGNVMASLGVSGQSVIYFIIIGCAGVNFLIELGINMIVSPSLTRIIKIIDKKVNFIPQPVEEESDDGVITTDTTDNTEEGGKE